MKGFEGELADSERKKKGKKPGDLDFRHRQWRLDSSRGRAGRED